jgi:hypothetical protein
MNRHFRRASLWQRFDRRLKALPPPGRGLGLHCALLGAANLGVRAGLAPAEIALCIHDAIPPGDRTVSATEIEQAVARACHDHGRSGHSARSLQSTRRTCAPLKFDGVNARATLIRDGGPCSQEDIVRSRANGSAPPDAGCAIQLVQTLFRPDDVLYMGTNDEDRPEVCAAATWCERMQQYVAKSPSGGAAYLARNAFEFMISNALTGTLAPKKDGSGLTLIGDNCVARHAYAIAEFDTLPLPEQCAFWRGWSRTFPGSLVALVFSGGKSLHAWLRVDARDAADWQTRVVDGLFAEVLIPLGVDPSTKNPARRTRVPGVEPILGLHRGGGGWYQSRQATRLLFLNSAGEAIR